MIVWYVHLAFLPSYPVFLSLQGTLRASSRLHDELFRRILRSPMKFFDTTPTGRILNRFSKDMDEGNSLKISGDVGLFGEHTLKHPKQGVKFAQLA